MATIYISSTYDDLKEYRDAVYKVLRQLEHDVIAMEDYVATDQRPLAKCLEDVERSDLYIGIFAWRYGYIPPQDNPNQKSITELEYRKAVETNKSPLLFLLDQKATWQPLAMDAVTGEGDRGARINALRAELGQENLVSFFQSPQELAKLVGTAVSKWVAKRTGKSVSLDDMNRRRYLENVGERYGTVKLPIGPQEGFYLHAVFQPLMLRRDPLAAEDLERRRRRPLLGEVELDEENLRRYGMSRADLERMGAMDAAPHLIVDKGEEALEKSPQKRVVVLGGPGTGKTTTLKYLAGQQAQRELASADAEVPIFFSLAAYAQSSKTLQRYLVDVVEDMKAEESYAQILWQEIEAGRAFLCLDSLDEVDPRSRPRVIEQINSWSAGKGNTWIVGSRFTEYKGGQFRPGQFAEWELLPMNRPIRLELARRLLPELQRLLTDANKGPLSAETFVTILEKHAQAAAWGENPLLFSLAAVVFLKIGHLPASRAALYREVVDAVLKTREHDAVRSKLLERMLTDLALWLYQSKGRTFTINDLIAFLFDLQRKSWGDTDDLVHRIISSGIVEIVAHDTYSFRHQTFQEYLAAAELARCLTSSDPTQRQQAWDLAWSKRTYSRWTEILRLMIGILAHDHEKAGRTLTHRWLRELLDQRKTGDPGNLALALALKSLTEVSELEEWALLDLTEIEQELITIWLQDLLVSAQYRRMSKVKRLIALAYDVGLLREHATDLVLDSLTQALDDRSEGVREAAVRALGGLGERLPLHVLFQPLQDLPGNVRSAAREILDEQGSRLLQEPILTEALKHISHNVRSAVVDVLGKQGEQVSLNVFMQALQDKNSDVRESAIEALGKQGERVSLDIFIQSLQDKNSDVRESAIEALGKQGERVSLDIFIQSLQDKDGDVRAAAIMALGRQGERVPPNVFIQALQDGDYYVRIAAIEELGKQGERVPLDIFIQALRDEAGQVQSAAMRVLGQQGERVSLDIFIQSLQDGDGDVRRAAMMALGKQREDLLRSQFLNIVKSENWMSWSAAVGVLSKQENRVPLNIFIQALQEGVSSIKIVAIRALGEIGEWVPLDIFTQVLRDENRNVRCEAVEVLSKRGERVPLDIFIQALQDEDGFVRSAAVEALGKRGEQVPLDIFIQALQDEDWDVQSAAMRALGQQGERVPLNIFIQTLRDRDGNVQSRVVEALGNQGERVPLDIFIQVLQDEDSYVRSAAVVALGNRGDRVPLDIFVEMLQDEDSFVRSAAIEALSKRGEQVSVDIFIKALEDEYHGVRIAAIEALGKRGEQIPYELVLPAIGDDNVYVQDAVIHLLPIPDPPAMLAEITLEASAILQGEEPGKFFGSITKGFLAEVIGEMGNAAPWLIEELLPMLDWHYWQVRVKAVRALGKIRRNIPDGVIKRLLELRDDPVRAVREAADDALADILSLEAGMEDEV